MLLVAGRTAGLAASFAIGIVLARVFDPAEFGVYKQFFLVYATLYGVLQLGMAESLYYFVPRAPERTGRYAANAIAALAVVGAGGVGLLYAARPLLAGWIDPQVAAYAVPLGVFLTLMLTATVLEIVMVCRQKHLAAAITYAISDIVRTILFIGPALLFVSLDAVFVGAIAYAALRLAAAGFALWRLCGSELRIDRSLLRQQLAYALPFALAVGVDVVLINYHQYVVAARFDAATFAIYAVGCLQIPLYDLIVTSTVNILMVKMADLPRGDAAVALWHDTVCRLAFLIFPLAGLLIVGAHDLILGLFTATYANSIPIFIVWVLTMLPAVMAVDAVLRVYAQTRFLLIMNLVRFACVAGMIGIFLSSFGLIGAVLVALVGLTVTKIVGVARVAWLMHLGLRDALPWRRLAGIAAIAILATVPVRWLQVTVAWPPLAMFVAGAVMYAATYGLLYFTGSQIRGLRAQAPRPSAPAQVPNPEPRFSEPL